ncbi:RcpC/CpaB family pilus assembly protein [Streptomyces sp. 24-1644]|uniref:RcpC/CpaB family pilus assembly protein n=1 Tax=Streptomyces sp. 24-1644 TaxID=3457315 RepID=UPI003FA73D37
MSSSSTPEVRTPPLSSADARSRAPSHARHPWLPVAAPAPCGVPPFPQLRVRGGGAHRLRRALRRQRRAMAAGLALTAAALAASGLSASGLSASGPGGEAGATAGVPGTAERQARLVSAPVRIADAATVRLLRPGDRVDVIAADDADSDARVVAKGVRVASVPRPAGDTADTAGDTATDGLPGQGGGALVVLSVERDIATALAGAGASGQLAVAVAHAH